MRLELRRHRASWARETNRDLPAASAANRASDRVHELSRRREWSLRASLVLTMLSSHALLSAACGRSSSPTLQIGALLPATGSLANDGQATSLAVALAVDEINAGGGLLGQQVEVVFRDDQSTADGAAAAARNLASNERISAVIGTICSACTLAASDVLAAHDIVLVSPESTAAALSGHNSYTFRTCPSDGLQAKLLAERAIGKHMMRVAVIHEAGLYGSGMASAFVQAYGAMGGTVTASVAYTEGKSSYVDLLTTIYGGATVPDAVLLVAYPVDGAQIVKDYLAYFSSHGSFWFFTDALEDSDFYQGVGPSMFAALQHEGTTQSAPQGPGLTEFNNAFRKRIGMDPSNGDPFAYDAAYLIALAVQQAGRYDGTAIRDNLRPVSDPPGMVIGPGQWREAVAAIKAGTKINYDGVTGSTDLDANGGVVGAYDVWQVQNGQEATIASGVLP